MEFAYCRHSDRVTVMQTSSHLDWAEYLAMERDLPRMSGTPILVAARSQSLKGGVSLTEFVEPMSGVSGEQAPHSAAQVEGMINQLVLASTGQTFIECQSSMSNRPAMWKLLA